jgi:hypothetical protein
MQSQIRGAACTDDVVVPLSIGSGQLPDEATTLRRRWPGGPAALTSRSSHADARTATVGRGSRPRRLVWQPGCGLCPQTERFRRNWAPGYASGGRKFVSLCAGCPPHRETNFPKSIAEQQLGGKNSSLSLLGAAASSARTAPAWFDPSRTADVQSVPIRVSGKALIVNACNETNVPRGTFYRPQRRSVSSLLTTPPTAT